MALDDSDNPRHRIATAIELNEAFQVIFVFGHSALAQDLVGQAVADAARNTGEAVNLLWFLPAEAAALTEERQDPRREVWVVTCGDGELQVADRLRELNRKRDTMANHSGASLIILLPASHSAGPAKHAPDLWSIRSVSLSVDAEQRTSQTEDALAAWQAGCEGAFASRLEEDPECRERYALGTYRFAYRIQPTKRLGSLRELRDLMSSIGGWTGWRPWWVPTGAEAPYSAENDVLECWMVAKDATFQDPAHSDFWRASPEGFFYLLRGYGEDSTDKVPPGKRLSLGLPIWRTGEALFHAQQVAENLVEGFAEIEFTAKWTGLRGRTTTEWPSPYWSDVSTDTTRRDVVFSSITTDVDEVKGDLVAVVARLLRPLYDAFLTAPSEAFVRSNLDDMRKRPVRH